MIALFSLAFPQTFKHLSDCSLTLPLEISINYKKCLQVLGNATAHTTCNQPCYTLNMTTPLRKLLLCLFITIALASQGIAGAVVSVQMAGVVSSHGDMRTATQMSHQAPVQVATTSHASDLPRITLQIQALSLPTRQVQRQQLHIWQPQRRTTSRTSSALLVCSFAAAYQRRMTPPMWRMRTLRLMCPCGSLQTYKTSRRLVCSGHHKHL